MPSFFHRKMLKEKKNDSYPFDFAITILNLVFGSNSHQDSVSSTLRNTATYFVIPGKFGPRWIVPFFSYQAKYVMSQWQPYNYSSRIKWKGILLAYSIGMLKKLPGIYPINIYSSNTIQIPGESTPFIPVIYIGTPGTRQKAVVTLVSPDSGMPKAIMKVALSENARKSLKQEAIILEQLSHSQIIGVPRLISMEENGMRSWQTVVEGELTSRKLTRAHIDLLLRLPKQSESSTINEQKFFLKKWAEKNLHHLGVDIQLITTAISKIHGEQIPLLLVHGDFAPWNLKLQKDGTISAIDWESADWASLPLWDLCHFYLIQAYLFSEHEPLKKMIRNPLVQFYLYKMQIDIENIFSLVLLYILFTISEIKGECSESYKNYLTSQLHRILGR